MPASFRIALATPPFPRTLEESLKHVEDFARGAAEQKARIVCFPESYVPGYRGPESGYEVAPHSQPALEAALEQARVIAKRYHIAMVLPMDWESPQGLHNVATVISPEGEVLGQQAKNQLDPSEDPIWVAGNGRQLFEVDGVKFGVVICHEGFRYPETVRWAARRGAQLVFHPHCAGSDRASARRLTQWRAPTNPYYESAMMCRALENTIYFASVNYAFMAQDSASTVIGPNGELVGHQPYGEAGVFVAELDLSKATGRLAARCRNSEYRD